MLAIGIWEAHYSKQVFECDTRQAKEEAVVTIKPFGWRRASEPAHDTLSGGFDSRSRYPLIEPC